MEEPVGAPANSLSDMYYSRLEGLEILLKEIL